MYEELSVNPPRHKTDHSYNNIFNVLVGTITRFYSLFTRRRTSSKKLQLFRMRRFHCALLPLHYIIHPLNQRAADLINIFSFDRGMVSSSCKLGMQSHRTNFSFNADWFPSIVMSRRFFGDYLNYSSESTLVQVEGEYVTEPWILSRKGFAGLQCYMQIMMSYSFQVQWFL